MVAGLAIAFVVSVAAATAKPSPKAVFSARVQAIGTQAQKALLAMPAQATPTTADKAASANELQVIYARVARRLAALTPPKAIKADFRTLVVSYQAAARNAGAWRDALLHGTSQQAAAASAALYNGPQAFRASQAIVRMSQEGYYFGTFFR